MNKNMQDWVASMSAADLRSFIRRIQGRLSTPLHGDEKERVLTMLRLMEPASTSNNQRTITETYFCGEVEYKVTYWDDSEITLEEMIE